MVQDRTPLRIQTLLAVTIVTLSFGRVNASEIGWTQYQANARHTGRVSSWTRPARLQHAWTTTAESLGLVYFLPGVVSMGPNVFVTASHGDNVHFSVLAIDRAVGDVTWTHDVEGQGQGVSEPSVGSGVVLVHKYGHSGGVGGDYSDWPHLVGMDAHDGSLKFASKHEGQWGSGSRPTISGGRAFIAGGYSGGLDSYDIQNGAGGTIAHVNQDYGWIPAIDQNIAYMYVMGAYEGGVRGTMFGYDIQTGEQVTSIVNAEDFGAPYEGTAFVGDEGRVFTFASNGSQPVLTAFDIPSQTIAWRSTGDFVRSLALDDGLAFAAKGRSLLVFDQTNGVELDRWTAPHGEQLASNVLLTDNAIFVGTDAATYAISRSTYRTIWSTPTAGSLALGADILYISNNQAIHAFSVPEPNAAALALICGVSLVGVRRYIGKSANKSVSS